MSLTSLLVAPIRTAGLLHGLDEEHFCSALGHECSRDSHLFAHLTEQQIASRLMVLKTCRQIDVSFCVDDANRVAPLGTRRCASLVRWSMLATFHVAPHVYGF